MNLNTGVNRERFTERLHARCGLFVFTIGPVDWIRSLSESFVGFIVVPLVVITLAWFVYWVFLRKPLRARHIRVLRERRELREAASRGPGDDS